MDKIKFKSRSSSDYDNLYIHNLGAKQKPIERVILHENVPGVSGTLVEHTGLFEAYERTITLVDRYGQHNLRDWLTGSGNLEISTEPGGFYKASIINAFEYAKIQGTDVKLLEVTFLIQPFFYLTQGQFPCEIKSEGTLINYYSVPAYPLIKVIGSGNLEFYFNNKKTTINNVEDFVLIDCDLFACYDNFGPKGKDMIGEFPILKEKINSFKTTNCTLEITPRWCEI